MQYNLPFEVTQIQKTNESSNLLIVLYAVQLHRKYPNEILHHDVSKLDIIRKYH